jgi:hypothetical protein
VSRVLAFIENWLMRQLIDEAKVMHELGFIERKERLQIEQCSGAWKAVAHCSSEAWGFYGCFNSGFGGFFSLAVDSWAFLDKLVCLPLIGGWTILTVFCSSALWQICQTLYLLFTMQKCRFTTPSQDAGMIVLSMIGGWDSHSSALGLQTQQVPVIHLWQEA